MPHCTSLHCTVLHCIASAQYIALHCITLQIQCHYSDDTMSAMASQITGVSIVCSTVCSGANQIKHQKVRITGLCEGHPPVTGGFPSQRASNAENVSTWCRHMTHPCLYILVDDCENSDDDVSEKISDNKLMDITTCVGAETTMGLPSAIHCLQWGFTTVVCAALPGTSAEG